MSATPSILLLTRDPYPEDPDAPTMGVMTADGLGSALQTLELPWHGNRQFVSCIPEGEYPLVMTWSEKRRTIWPHIANVPGRSAIEVHTGDWAKDSLGCVIVGMVRGTDGRSVYSSHQAFGLFSGWLARALAAGTARIRIVRAGGPPPAPLSPPSPA
jgi:hypothetical protein